jgi:hypothetical protein
MTPDPVERCVQPVLSAFDDAIARIYEARKLWHEQGKLSVFSADMERSLALAQWQRSQTGDDLAEWIRELIEFLRPADQSQIALVLWEVFHRIKGTPHRKMKMDRAVEKLMQVK